MNFFWYQCEKNRLFLQMGLVFRGIKVGSFKLQYVLLKPIDVPNRVASVMLSRLPSPQNAIAFTPTLFSRVWKQHMEFIRV